MKTCICNDSQLLYSLITYLSNLSIIPVDATGVIAVTHEWHKKTTHLHAHVNKMGILSIAVTPVNTRSFY